jgi:hypothetical protein
VLVNNAPISRQTLLKYATNCAEPVRRRAATGAYARATIVQRELAWQVEDGKLRHEPHQLARALTDLIATANRERWAHPISA